MDVNVALIYNYRLLAIHLIIIINNATPTNMATCTSSEGEIEDEMSSVIIIAIIRGRRRRKHPKRFWVRDIFSKRRLQSEYHNLLQEMRLSDEESHFKYIRMSPERFDLLLSQV